MKVICTEHAVTCDTQTWLCPKRETLYIDIYELILRKGLEL